MASISNFITILVVLTIVNFSSQNANDNRVETESQDESPLAEAAAAILKEQNLQNIGSMVSSLLQSGAAKDIVGNILQKAASSPQAAEMLQGLGNVLASAGDKNDHSADGLEGLSSLLGSLPGGEGSDASAAVLQGLGSLLGGGEHMKEGLDPAVIGSMVNMFMNAQKEDKPKVKHRKVNSSPKNKQDEPAFDMGDLLSLAGNFLGDGGQKKGGGNFMEYLPMLLQTVSAFTGQEAQERAESHSEHASFLPPILERFHLMFDNFIHSDMGKMVLNAIGAEKAFKMFNDENGKFNYIKFVEMTENHSFRRHWIRMITDRLVDVILYVSDPKTYQEYLTSGQLFINSFLKSQGFPKNSLLDAKKPTESISAFVNYAAKKYFDVRIKSKEYVKPVVRYVQELLQISRQKSISGKEHRDMSDKLADTINLEIIEPIARVHRAYRFGKQRPKCDRYVFCLINQPSQNEEESLPSLKKLLYRGSTLLAFWYLSDSTETTFWTIYSDIFEGVDCKTLHLELCNDFHEEELKVTTEYVHTEL